MHGDVYLKKVIDFKYRGKNLKFRVSQDLFSSFQIDIGTRFLLKTIIPSGSHSFAKILDLGCGYGPLGLVLKSANEASVVHMVDRDALAVEYSRQNAELNGLSGVQAYGSLGYDGVCENDFELIISNIPGKAGEAVITHFLRDARYFLKSGGLVAIVVVMTIEPMVRRILDDTPDIDIIMHQTRSGHAVFHYRFIDKSGMTGNPFIPGLDKGVYARHDMTFHHKDLTFPMQTARGLPEFDSLNYRTELLLDGLRLIERTKVGHIAIINPGQGHVAVALWHMFQPDNITLVDRDLLSLRYSQKNLTSNGCRDERIASLHRIGFSLNGEERADLIAVILREEEGPAAVFEIVRDTAGYLAPGGRLLAVAGSTAISRLVEKLQVDTNIELIERMKRKGYCLIILRAA